MNIPTILRPTITTTAPAYTAGDVIGGLLQIPTGVKFGSGEIRSFALSDNLSQSAPMTMMFFRSKPLGPYVDNGPFAWGVGDNNLFCGAIGIAAADYVVAAGKSIVSVATQVGVEWVVPTDPTNVPNIPVIYAVLVTSGTPTYAANATTLTISMELGYSR